MQEKQEQLSYAIPPQKIFRDVEHYRRVRTAILSALTQAGSKGQKKSTRSSYLINRLVVRFSNRVDEEEIFIDYLNGQIVLEAPRRGTEVAEVLSQRRMYYFSNLLASVEAIAVIGITHVFLVLDDAGRRQLESSRRGRPLPSGRSHPEGRGSTPPDRGSKAKPKELIERSRKHK